MEEHAYEGRLSWALGLCQALGIPILIGTVLGTLVILVVCSVTRAKIGAMVVWAGWMLVVGLVSGFGFMNAFPTVWISDEHLTISAYLNARISIPWTEVVDVRQGAIPFGGVLVRTRRISPFHRLYGWLYSQSLLPSFVIVPEISGYADLVREIQHRANVAKEDRQR